MFADSRTGMLEAQGGFGPSVEIDRRYEGMEDLSIITKIIILNLLGRLAASQYRSYLMSLR